MVSTGRSGPVFGCSESAGNSLQALTHQPQACHLSATPPPQASAWFCRKWGWGGVNHDPEALQNPGLFLEATETHMRKKKALVFGSSNFPF